MSMERYRKFLIVVFTVYLFFFIYYLSYTIYTHASGESLAVIHVDQEHKANEEPGESDIKLMPLGMTVGIYIRSKGIMVLDTGEVTDLNGDKEKPTKNCLKSGDYITCFNGNEIDSIKTFTELIQENGTKECTVTVLREGKETNVEITPVQTENNTYKLGVWVRQDAQGIGTLSFMDKDGNFVALGHGITDIDTGAIIDIQYGKLYEPQIFSIVKGKDGAPGEIIGHIDYKNSPVLGVIKKNSSKGIYGNLTNSNEWYDESKALPMAKKDEVKEGEAWIRCCVDSEIKDYQIEIERVEKISLGGEKNFVIKINDEELLKKTNGIVQGMSGSPIIQDGKLVGAVTHVFVNDPTRGYGILIENMLEASGGN